MKALPWVLVVLLVIAYFWSWPIKQTTVNGKRDTITVIDTIRDTVPKAVLVTFWRTDTAYLPLLTDSGTGELVPVEIPIERKEYKTDEYRAIVSGYRPSLDFMETYNKRETITITPDVKRWGIGLQAGYGYPGGAYVGVGVSYDLWRW